jgi:hypothetical protein
MPFSKNSLRLAKWIYWIVGLFMHLWVCYTLFVIEHAVTAIIWLILGLVLLVIMYMYYFAPGDTSSNWPPYITVCPDYLTSVSQGDGKGVTSNVCFDFVGLNSKLLKADPQHLPQPSDSNYTKYAFDPSGTVSQKVAKAQANGLTWQGLF